jgi:hypothetical protein
LALKTRAGHSSMATTEIYLHLAGTAFHDEAAALDDGCSARTVYQTMYQPEGTHRTWEDQKGMNKRLGDRVDLSSKNQLF